MNTILIKIVEKVSKHTILESIREESIGDLWESDSRIKKNQKQNKFIRVSRFCYNFLLLIKASILIYFQDRFLNRDTCDFKELVYPIEVQRQYLNANNICLLKKYCYARKSFDEISSQKILKSSDSNFLYWVNQIERIIASSNIEKLDNDKCEALVNSLKLSNFVRKIESFPPNFVSSEIFNNLVQEINLNTSFIDKYVEFSPNNFVRKLICRTWSIAVYVISWNPGQESLLHHHGYALDAIIPIYGKMTHWLLSPDQKVPFESFEKTQKYEGNSEVFTKGDIVIVKRRYAHQISNNSAEKLVTLNVRFGYPPEDNNWRSTADSDMFIWNQTERFFDLMVHHH